MYTVLVCPEDEKIRHKILCRLKKTGQKNRLSGGEQVGDTIASTATEEATINTQTHNKHHKE